MYNLYAKTLPNITKVEHYLIMKNLVINQVIFQINTINR